MRLAYITSQFPYGPNEAFLSAEIGALAQYAQELVIVPTRPKSRAPMHETHGLRVVHLTPLGLRTFGLALMEALSHPNDVMRVLSVLLRSRYRPASKLKNVALLPKALAVARVLRGGGIGHIHAHWLSTPSTVAYIASVLTGIPWSCTAHRFDIFEDNLLSEKARTAAFVRTISERNRDLIMQKTHSVLNGRCTVLHLGVDLPRLAGEPSSRSALSVVCAASLVPVKGHRYLLEALALLKDRAVPVTCDLAGEGPLRAAIERDIHRLGVAAMVRLRGHVDHDRLCAEMRHGRYDVAVLTSTEEGTTFEGVPAALMEAMAAGVCCIATRTGSIPELINDDRCSRLVPQRDPVALADTLERLYRDATYRAEIGRAARERIEQAFNVQRTAKQLYDLIAAR